MAFNLNFSFSHVLLSSLILILVAVLLTNRPVECKPSGQRGGWDDPYAWIRPWVIIDFFRNFWLTR
jgi:hypothetical protein